MITFLGILFGLLAINAILIVFSVNRTTEKPAKNILTGAKSTVTKLFSEDTSETEYKKAV